MLAYAYILTGNSVCIYYPLLLSEGSLRLHIPSIMSVTLWNQVCPLDIFLVPSPIHSLCLSQPLWILISSPVQPLPSCSIYLQQPQGSEPRLVTIGGSQLLPLWLSTSASQTLAASESPGGLVKTQTTGPHSQFLIHRSWVEPKSSWVMLIMLF